MYHPRNISGGFVLIGLALAIIIGHGLFLPIFFTGLAFAALFGAWGMSYRGARYGGINGFVWFMTLALCFLTGMWTLILLGIGLSIVLGAFRNPINNQLNSWNLGPRSYQPQAPYQNYQQPNPPYQQPNPTYQQPPQTPQERPYNEGYTPPVRPAEQPPIERPPVETDDPYGAQQQYNQPQSQYPQQLPPQE
ncbi:hypothetical protein [Dictyobacter kobayashii]|uniref:Uncharacterized protein n=1 Tax=Dictyobacter kobayashii TaxID=2014872 RepID=A0A402ARD6_9CHLR|nr:hypothetical protein [Dictyobacter kobayashii]GCE21649.1 hypothetical protein KDK_54490 [Dictyobacter kobayashii]